MTDNAVMSSSYGHYQIVSQIGKGGMGAVYLANDTVLDRKVALKILLSAVAQDKERIRRFIQEAKAASALNHPNILTIFEIGEANSTHYLVTEYIKGDTLRDLIRKGTADLRKKIDIGVQTAAALDAAHHSGIIHRDVKPENVMVREDGLVKVLDFGLAKLAPKTERAASDAATLEHYKTGPGIVVGTTAYMSPEQARGHELDNRTDMFSLGTVLYELFTGRHPFPGESHADVVSSILREEPAPVTQRVPELPKELERIIEKLLRKDRDERYQSIKDLQLDLEDIRDDMRFESKNSHSKQPPTVESRAPLKEGSFRSAFTSSIVVKPRFTMLHAILFGLLAILGFVGIWFLTAKFFPPPPEPGSYPTAEIANWSSTAGEISTAASFSPDGKLIAYTSTRSGSSNIWVTQANSQNSIQVTNDLSSNTDPIWSPKGDEIAFFSNHSGQAGSGKNSAGIWRVPALGGAPRLIGTVPKANPELRYWTSTGKIYFQLDGNLYTLDAANGEVRQITSFAPNDLKWIDISRDETKIAYLKRIQDNWSIAISNIDTSNAVDVATGTGGVGGIAWNQDKERIYYSADVGGVKQVFRSREKPESSIRITAAETDCIVEDVSPDGRTIIVGSAREESNLWRVALNDGKELPVVKDLDEKLWPSVSPDDKRITYQSARTMFNGKLFDSSIMVKDMTISGDSGRPRMVAENGFLPTWSNSGEKIAFLRKAEKEADLVIADAGGSIEARSVANGIPFFGYSVTPYNPMYPRAFAWSPDNTAIVYTSKKNGASNLWIISLANNTDQAVTNNLDTQTDYFSPTWSPDGMSIAFLFRNKGAQPESASTRGISIFDLATGQERHVYQTLGITRVLGWISDGKQLLIADAAKEFESEAQETTIRTVPANGGTPTELAKIPSAYYFNIYLSSDSKMIAFAARNEKVDDIWTLPAIGGNARKVTSNNDSEVYFSRLAWFRDGSAIVFGKQTRFSLLSMISEID